MSRIAIQDRPMRERAMLRAIQASAMTKASTNRYFASLLAVAPVTWKPKTLRGGADGTPEIELLTNHGTLTNSQSRKNCAARVATAR